MSGKGFIKSLLLPFSEHLKASLKKTGNVPLPPPPASNTPTPRSENLFSTKVVDLFVCIIDNRDIADLTINGDEYGVDVLEVNHQCFHHHSSVPPFTFKHRLYLKTRHPSTKSWVETISPSGGDTLPNPHIHAAPLF